MNDDRSPPGARPLEPDRATVARWLDAAKELVLDHLDELETAPAGAAEGALDRLHELVEPLPEDGAELTGLLERVVRDWVPASFNTAGPGYLAYIPGGGIVPSAIADLVADVTNRYVGVFAAAPLLARLEMTAIRWIGDLFDQPPLVRTPRIPGGW
ncbi:MAG: decarboxylase, partial [Planctomycetota bacterium JB042]